MSASHQTWTTDWPNRLRDELRSKGYESITSFLSQFPAEPYVDVARRIAPWVAGMQVSRLHMQEAKLSGQLRAAAMDALARDLNWRLPDGWVPDSTTESRAAGAAATSTTSVVVDGDAPHFKPRMLEVYKGLKACEPAVGWKPSGPDDPLICDAFARGWPVGFSETLSRS